MKVLKLATAGSVDDGKSTLIGRVLFDTKSLTDDKLEAIQISSKKRGLDHLDFSLATDGLVAEREQGITIDVAHIYFSTQKRSYIIADTPGHVEYTRNMVTGASTSQASIVLVDARNGVVEQTKRHFFINNLLRVKNIIVAVNKMDLVGFSQEKFQVIKDTILELADKSTYQGQSITFIPISALLGDNVVNVSTNTPWYTGTTLLDHLENIDVEDVYEEAQTRFPVQTVIRPNTEEYHDFRGYAGKLYGGNLSVGDAVVVLPSQTKSKVKEIHFFKETLTTAKRGNSVIITLEDDVNVSRGDMLVKVDELPTIEKQLEATICWMDKQALKTSSKYIVQHGVNSVKARVSAINSVIETDFSGVREAVDGLKINEIGKIELSLSKPLYFDDYADNKSNGSFILVDTNTNTTAGVGFINSRKSH